VDDDPQLPRSPHSDQALNAVRRGFRIFSKESLATQLSF